MAKSDKPLYWGLFAAGGTVTAFVAPAVILAVALAVPLGLFDREALSYERVTAFLDYRLIKVAVLGVLVLALWHAAHRLRTTLHDFGIGPDKKVAKIAYRTALGATILATGAMLIV